MGKYSSYATRIDTLVRSRFLQFEKAEEAYDKAKREKESTPVRHGFGITPEYQIKAQKAEVNFADAEIKYKEAREILQNTLSEFREIRADLLEDVAKDSTVDPSDLDRNVVDLLQSGIVTAPEIIRLYNDARNVTTKRFISKFANDEYQKLLNTPDVDHESREAVKNYEQRQQLLAVVEESKAFVAPEESEAVQLFDGIGFALSRTIENPGMIGDWGKLTTPLLEKL